MRSLNTQTGRPAIADEILKNPGVIAMVCYMTALYYASCSFNPTVAEHTRISEHALMPGIVNEKFDKEGRIVEMVQGLKEHHGDRRSFIIDRLRDYGVNAYEQKWSTRVAISNSSGINLWGVVRGSRAASIESILLAVDIKDDEAVGIATAFMAYAREQVYWSRDIFLLCVDGGVLGMDAFLSQFHMIDSDVITAERLKERGDSMLATIVLRVSSSRKSPRAIDLNIHQLNGALPNLDLFNTIVRICGQGRYHLPVTLYGIKDVHEGGSSPWWYIPSRFMFSQAFSQIDGLHSVCAKYAVQGLSITVPPHSVLSARQSTRLVEAVMRSLNNVLERFHQSYFMYVLADEDNFVSIAYFMPILGGVVAPLLIFAYSTWVFSLPVLYVPTSYWMPHAIGVATWKLSSAYFASFNQSREAWIVLIVVLCIPWGLIISTPCIYVPSLRFLLLLECALVAGMIGLLNFPLALLCAIPTIPLIVKVSQENESRPRQLVRTVLTMFSHPLVLSIIWIVYGREYIGYKNMNIKKVSIDTVISIVKRLLTEHILLGSHTFPLLVVFVTPCWNVLCRLAVAVTSFPVVDKEKKE